MEINDTVLLVVTVSWLAAAIAIVVLHRKQLTRLKCCLALIVCGLGAASAHYCFLHWAFELERHSAAHLVGVTHLRLNDDAEFLQSHLGSALERADGSALFRSDEWQRAEGGGVSRPRQLLREIGQYRRLRPDRIGQPPIDHRGSAHARGTVGRPRGEFGVDVPGSVRGRSPLGGERGRAGEAEREQGGSE